MKPDWSSKNVPDWANYAAQEASGSWYWYSHRPTYSEICTEWQSPGQRQIIPKVELRPQETLEERPYSGVAEFEAELLRRWHTNLIGGTHAQQE